MSEIIELNGFGSQDWPNRVNNTDPVINPRLPFLPHPAASWPDSPGSAGSCFTWPSPEQPGSAPSRNERNASQNIGLTLLKPRWPWYFGVLEGVKSHPTLRDFFLKETTLERVLKTIPEKAQVLFFSSPFTVKSVYPQYIDKMREAR